MKKGIIIIGLLAPIILGGLYANRKFCDPKHRLNTAKTEVKQLADNDVVIDPEHRQKHENTSANITFDYFDIKCVCSES